MERGEVEVLLIRLLLVDRLPLLLGSTRPVDFEVLAIDFDLALGIGVVAQHFDLAAGTEYHRRAVVLPASVFHVDVRAADHLGTDIRDLGLGEIVRSERNRVCVEGLGGDIRVCVGFAVDALEPDQAEVGEHAKLAAG